MLSYELFGTEIEQGDREKGELKTKRLTVKKGHRVVRLTRHSTAGPGKTLASQSASSSTFEERPACESTNG